MALKNLKFEAFNQAHSQPCLWDKSLMKLIDKIAGANSGDVYNHRKVWIARVFWVFYRKWGKSFSINFRLYKGTAGTQQTSLLWSQYLPIHLRHHLWHCT